MLNSILLLFGSFGAPEVIIILVIILLLFGGKKIPELMKGLGKGVKSFKEGMNEVKDEIEKPLEDAANDVKRVTENKDSVTNSDK
jgi:sec-independent protein translocase protein TatA